MVPDLPSQQVVPGLAGGPGLLGLGGGPRFSWFSRWYQVHQWYQMFPGLPGFAGGTMFTRARMLCFALLVN